MKETNCKHCTSPFFGRSNQIYCSITCKAQTNNAIAAQRKKATRPGEVQLRVNHLVLDRLYREYRNQSIDKRLLHLMGFEAEFFTGIKRNESKNLYLIFDFGYFLDTNDTIKIVKDA